MFNGATSPWAVPLGAEDLDMKVVGGLKPQMILLLQWELTCLVEGGLGGGSCSFSSLTLTVSFGSVPTPLSVSPTTRAKSFTCLGYGFFFFFFLSLE